MTTLTQPRILLAEDNVVLARIAQFNLERATFAVKVASDGQMALEFARQEHFDLLVTDEQMPRMSGVELCQRLRNDERYAETPIVFLTGKQLDLGTLRDELQISTIIRKPYSPKMLVMAATSLLAGSFNLSA